MYFGVLMPYWVLNDCIIKDYNCVCVCVCVCLAAAVRQPDEHGEGGELCERRAERHAEGERGPEGARQGRPAEGAGERGSLQGLRQR